MMTFSRMRSEQQREQQEAADKPKKYTPADEKVGTQANTARQPKKQAPADEKGGTQ